MYGWIVGFMIRRSVRSLNAGDLGPLLSAYAEDVHFVFPGDSSFAADIHSRRDLELWLRRFTEVGLGLELQEIAVSGWPWNTTVCIRVTDRLTNPSGDVVYENRGVIVGEIIWGKIKSYEVFVDTQKLAALDEYLASQEAGAKPEAR